ncbi:amidase [Actinoplanes sp. NPDC049265]|uniref:amidase n=1 Tax=Actinoplanes sp. NPDC049265 TaxID=3363902 RepID=UPI0037221A1C
MIPREPAADRIPYEPADGGVSHEPGDGMSLLSLPARAVLTRLRDGRLTATEVLAAVTDRLAEVDPVINAVPLRVPAPPVGLPITVKDVIDVAGLPTTFGSAALCSAYQWSPPGPTPRAEAVSRASDPLVRRLESHGLSVIGKTNVPEFLSGPDTTNDLFGTTRNPWDPALTCGASSGGAAASVASGTSWLAHGEDTAGSIRIPAAFCGVVGLRPTPGLVPVAPAGDPVPGFTVHGPIARDVGDALLMLRAMAPDLPLARPVRSIGYSADLGGRVPVDPEIAQVCAEVVAALGAPVEAVSPEVDGWHEACLDLLAHRAAVLHGPRVDRFGDRLGAGIRAEVEAGRSLPPARLAAARATHGSARRAAARERRDDLAVLITPAFGVPPWRPPADLPAVAASWPLATLATMSGRPALVVPCGVIGSGLPVALQLIGPPGSDLALLDLGREVERVRTMPPLPFLRATARP